MRCMMMRNDVTLLGEVLFCGGNRDRGNRSLVETKQGLDGGKVYAVDCENSMAIAEHEVTKFLNLIYNC